LPKLLDKYSRLKDIIAGYGRVAVAFSGGIDSSLLLYAACQALGPKTTAYFANSVVQSTAELDNCRKIASFIDVDLLVFEFDLLADSDFYDNGVDRCFYCKQKVYNRFLDSLKIGGDGALLDGTNLDDDDTLRPGSRAVDGLGVKTPLRLAGFDKKDIRLLGRELGLPNWQRPSGSCLATRIAPGSRITARKLAIISQGEDILYKEGLRGFRLRIYDNYAVAQLVKDDFLPFMTSGINEKLREFLKTEGLQEFFLDLSGREGILI